MTVPTFDTFDDDYDADPRPDPKVTYLLDGIPIGEIDRWGCQWIVRTTKGWWDPPEFRNTRDELPDQHGASEGVAYAGPRLIVLNVTVVCPDLPQRILARDRARGMCADGARLYDLTVTDQLRRVSTAQVKRDGKGTVETKGTRKVEMMLPLVAPDPRIYGPWQEPLTNPPGSSLLQTGADFDSERGLDFSGAGLDFFDVALNPSTGRCEVANYGNTPTAPILRITGPAPTPSVLHLESGTRIRYQATVEAGEQVFINCGGMPARGLLGHECRSSRRGDVRALVSVSGLSWPTVDAGQVGTFTFDTYGTAPTELQVALRSASL